MMMIPKNNSSRNRNILPPKAFAKRMFRYFLISFAFMCVSIFVGVIGYQYFGDLSWIDSFYISTMILTGMGPTCEIASTAGKIFSSFYALFSGIVFLTTAAIFISPIAHRLLHILHVEEEDENEVNPN
jgi:magnesium-transporting ATPase (P-type)